jgi:DNA-binding transcriptional LysR family regulator
LSYAEADRPADRIAGLEVLRLYDEHYALVTPHDPALPATLSWSDLPRFELALLTPDMQNRRILDRHLSRAGISVSARIESNSVVALISHIDQHGVATILPRQAADFFSRGHGLACLPLDPLTDSDTDVAFILPPVGRRTLLLDAFVQSLS